MSRLALLGRPVPELAGALRRLLEARARGTDAEPALGALARVLRDAARLADMTGRADLLRGVRREEGGTAGPPVRRPRGVGARGETIMFAAVGGVKPVPAVPFAEAIEDLLDRFPTLAEGWREVQEVYTLPNAFAVARSADLELTAQVQERLARALRDGLSERDAARALLNTASRYDATGWTDAYARLVFRTNAATAHTAGVWRQATDPDVAGFVVGFVYRPVGDADTRPNHQAGVGFVAAVDDPRWAELAPPNGYGCRCIPQPLDRLTARRQGLIDERTGELVRMATPDGFGPDAGFRKGARPDLERYGGRVRRRG